jgi:WD40 repeat protein/tRNA A-37 threonylcarbamoyl transferase component Bud32
MSEPAADPVRSARGPTLSLPTAAPPTHITHRPHTGLALTPAPAASTEPHPDWPSIASYEILGEVGRGGMGVVYKARQVKLNRLTALKMMVTGSQAMPEQRARFRGEAEAVARLQHPNIVQIYEIGEQDGRPYLALEYVPGPSLAQALTGTPQPARPSAQLVRTLADALHHAHQQGIVHRDLKPANVLLSFSREPLASADAALAKGSRLNEGVPKVTDFGLAKYLDAPSGPTQTGAIVGTPSYMAPEQASQVKDVGPAADVYALGAILYELLTGRPPFVGETVLDTLDQVRHADPVAPRQLQPKLPRDLETICLKCLRKEPLKRYENALALVDDLERFLQDRPIKARPVGRTERTVKWVRQNRALAGLLVVAALAVAALGAGGTWFIARLRHERDLAWSAKQDAEKQREAAEVILANADARAQSEAEARVSAVAERRRAEVKLQRSEMARYASQLGLAQQFLQMQNLALAREVLANCRWDLRGWEYDYLWRLCNRRPAKSFPADLAAGVHAGAPSRDGHRLDAVAVDHTVKIRNVDTGQELLTCRGHSDRVVSTAFSPDGRRLASASADKTIRIWDTATGQELLALTEVAKEMGVVLFSADGQWLALVGGRKDSPGELNVWEATSDPGQQLAVLKGHSQAVTSVAASGDGQRLASSSEDGAVKLWDAARAEEPLATLPGHAGEVTAVAFSGDGQRLASASRDQTVRIWDPATSRELHVLKGHSDAVLGVAFSPDGQQLATASADRSVRLWDVASGRELRVCQGQSGQVTSVAFSPDGKRLASTGGDHLVKIWDVATGQEVHSLHGHKAWATCVAFSSDGRRLVSGGLDQIIHIWDAVTGQELLDLANAGDAITAVAFSPDTRLLATASGDSRQPLKPGAIKIWEVATGKEVLSLSGHTGAITGVAFSPDSRRLISGSHDQTLRVWEVSAARTPR